MVSIGELIGYLRLDDKLSPALKVASANVKTAAKNLDELGESTQKAGQAMLPISAAIAGAGFAAFKFGKDFETVMTQIRSLVGESAEQVQTYKAAVLDLSKDVGKTPQELAEALYFITSSGQQGAAALQTLEVAAKASAIGLGETKTVADAATSAINAYGKENITAEEAVRVLVATVREGKGEADAIAGSMGRIIPIAAEMGVRFQDLGSFIAATTKIGLSAEEAATALRGALTTISAPTKEQTDAFADLAERGLLPLGFSLEDVRKKIQEEGLAQGFMQLTEATKGNSEALTAIIGNVRAATGVLGAYGKQGEETLRIQGKMRTDLNEIADGFNLVSQTVDFKWKQALADMQGVAIHAFDAIKPAMVNVVDGASGVTKALDAMVSGFQKLPQPIQTSIVALAGLTALAGPALVAVGAAMKGIAVAMDGLALGLAGAAKAAGPLLTVLGAIGTLAAAGAAAIAGWKLGEKISEIKAFGDEQMSLGESFTFGVLKLQQWAGQLDATDAEIENSILAQRKLGAEVQATADGITEVTEGIGFMASELATPMSQAKNLTAEFNAEMNTLKASVIALTAEQREAIRTGLEMEKGTGDIATGLGVTEAAVKAYAAGLEEASRRVDEFLEKQNRSIAATKDLWSENAAMVAEATGTSMDARIAAIEANFQKEVAAIQSTGAVYEAHYAALRANADAATAALSSNWSEVRDMSLEALQQQAQAARNTYEQMMFSGLTFSREVLEGQRQKVRELEDAVRSYGSSWNASVQQGGNAIDEMNRKLDEQIAKFSNIKQAMDQTFSMDIQPLTKTQIREIQGDFDPVGSMLNRDPKEALRKKLAQLEELEGTYRPKTKLQYNQMINDQVMLSQLRMMDLSSDVSVKQVAGGVVPTTMSGSTPTGTATTSGWGGGGSVTMNNYINGTGEQVARIVSAELMRTVKAGRQLGSA